MDVLILAHLSTSYDEWKKVFDSHADARAPFISGTSTAAQVDDQTAMVASFGVDLQALNEFMNEPERAAEIASVTTGHTMYTLTEMQPPS